MVTLIPEHVASRIVAIQEQLHDPAILVLERTRLQAEQSKLWDEVFRGKPYEEIAALVKPFMLAA